MGVTIEKGEADLDLGVRLPGIAHDPLHVILIGRNTPIRAGRVGDLVEEQRVALTVALRGRVAGRRNNVNETEIYDVVSLIKSFRDQALKSARGAIVIGALGIVLVQHYPGVTHGGKFGSKWGIF